MNSPHPPPPSAVCPNCGATRDASLAYCANCGAPQLGTATGAASTSKTILSILLGMGALGFGSVGACLGLIGVIGGNISTDWGFIAIGFAALVAAVACAWGIFHINKK